MAHRPTVVRFSLSIFFYVLLTHSVITSAADQRGTKEVVTGHDALCQLLTRNVPKVDTRALTSHVIGQSVDMNSIKRRLEKFTGATPLSDGLVIDDRGGAFARAVTRRLIFEELQEMGLEPTYETFNDGHLPGANVVATIKGTKNPDEVVEVTAHYDSVENPGADDNGSGVAFNLELARIAKMASFDRTLRFVFTDLEEDERQGSKGHLQLNQGKPAKIVAAIVVDTIAWGDKSQQRQLAVVEVGTPAMFQGRGFKPQKDLALGIAYLLGRFPAPGTVDFSIETEDSEPKTADHGVYWKAGIPSVLIGEANESGLLNPGYHGREDNLSKINWDYYTSVTRQAAGIVFSLAGANVELGNQGAVKIAKIVAELEQRHVVPVNAIPESLDWGIYEPPRSSSSYSSSSSTAGWENSQVDAILKAMKEVQDPKRFVVGLMDDDEKGDRARIFAIDFVKGRHWELVGIDRKTRGLPLIEAALDAGVVVIDQKDKKDQMLYTSDARRAFMDYFEEDLEKLKEKVKFTVREPRPKAPSIVLPARVKEFMDSVGLTDYEGKESLVIGVVDKVEGRSKLSPFFIIDPKLKKSISRRNLLSLSDLELLAKWLEEKNVLIDILFIEEDALESAGGDIAILGYNFAAVFGKDGDALANKGIVFVKVDLSPATEAK